MFVHINNRVVALHSTKNIIIKYTRDFFRASRGLCILNISHFYVYMNCCIYIIFNFKFSLRAIVLFVYMA